MFVKRAFVAVFVTGASVTLSIWAIGPTSAQAPLAQSTLPQVVSVPLSSFGLLGSDVHPSYLRVNSSSQLFAAANWRLERAALDQVDGFVNLMLADYSPPSGTSTKGCTRGYFEFFKPSRFVTLTSTLLSAMVEVRDDSPCGVLGIGTNGWMVVNVRLPSGSGIDLDTLVRRSDAGETNLDHLIFQAAKASADPHSQCLAREIYGNALSPGEVAPGGFVGQVHFAASKYGLEVGISTGAIPSEDCGSVIVSIPWKQLPKLHSQLLSIGL